MTEKTRSFPVTLPPDLVQHAIGLVEHGVYIDVADYVRDLMRRDRDIYLSQMRQKIDAGWKSAKNGKLIDGDSVFDELDKHSISQRKLRKKK